MITIQDIIDLALPDGTSIVAGHGQLTREVTWATRPRPIPPTFGHLKGGELVLLTSNVLQNLGERFTLEAAIKELVKKVSAVAFAGRIVAAARNAAEAAELPLLQLPNDVDLATLERSITDLVSERRRDTQRRSHESGRRLMELAINGEPLDSLVRTLAEISNKPVVIEHRDGRIRSIEAGDHPLPSREHLVQSIEHGRPTIAAWLRTVVESSPAEPPTLTVAFDETRRRLVSPIFGRDGLLGFLSLLLNGEKETVEDAYLASRGAAASAIVIGREWAAIAAKQEVELNVLDEVLDGALRSEISLIKQASRLNHNLEAPHIAIVARLDTISGTAARPTTRPHERRRSIFDETLTQSGSRLLWRLRHNHAEIIRPIPEGTDPSDIAANLHEELSKRLTDQPDTVVSMGVGRVRQGPTGIRESYREAKQALTMGRKLKGPGELTRFDDLGVYRLLYATQSLPELRSFHDEALGALIEYDRNHGAELIKTLEAFFEARCGPKEAAALLGVHRNTVLYRLERIRELTEFDLDDANVRLRLHLALCANTAIFSDES